MSYIKISNDLIVSKLKQFIESKSELDWIRNIKIENGCISAEVDIDLTEDFPLATLSFQGNGK